jgi:hypothetical protein
VFDGLSGVLYFDDGQVVVAYVEKLWAEPGEGPGVSLSAWEWEQT